MDANGMRRDADNIAIVLMAADPDTLNTYTWRDSSENVHLAGVKTYAVGVNASGMISMEDFVAMAALPRVENDNYFLTNTWEGLEDARMRMMSAGGFIEMTTPAPSTTPASPHPTPPPCKPFAYKLIIVNI